GIDSALAARIQRDSKTSIDDVGRDRRGRADGVLSNPGRHRVQPEVHREASGSVDERPALGQGTRIVERVRSGDAVGKDELDTKAEGSCEGQRASKCERLAKLHCESPDVSTL